MRPGTIILFFCSVVVACDTLKNTISFINHCIMPEGFGPFTVLPTVASTNNYAMERTAAGMTRHGEAFFTTRQSEGRGQRGKSWNSADGENIALSIVINPFPLDMEQQFLLSAAVAVSCASWFSQYAGEPTRIKWPNDIYWRDRKAAGILIENTIGQGIWKWAVVGIGVNINQTVFDEHLPNPVSLKQITGKEHPPEQLAHELHQVVTACISRLTESNTDRVLKEYNRMLHKKGERVKMRRGSIEFETQIREVDSVGRLHTRDHIDNFFSHGEVEWLSA
jgi:BirA family biotin operon repressor/biotin-[acetyl-CoA-carboxylase] ligase